MSPVDKLSTTPAASNARPLVPAKGAAPTEKPAAKPAIAQDTLKTVGRPVAPQPGRLTAREQMLKDKPKFGSPDEYGRTIVKFTGYLETAKADLRIAESALEAEKTRLADADAEFSKPLRAAQKVMSDTHALYQQPIDRFSGELRAANEALQDAIYPGRQKAAQLDAEAARLASTISQLDGDISQARSRIGSLESAISMAMSRRSSAQSDRTNAEARIRELEPTAPSDFDLSSQRGRVNDAASRLRDAESRLATANGAVSKKREIERQISDLSSALDSVKSAESELSSAKGSASAYKGQVTRAQNKLDSAMALPETDASKATKVTEARSALREAEAKYTTAQGRVSELEGRIARYGSASSVSSQLSSLRSQLSQYSNADSEYSSASQAKSSAQSSYDTVKRRLDDMENTDRQLDRARSDREQAIRTYNESNATIASGTAEKEQKNREIYQLQSQLETKTDERGRIVSEANKQRSLQNPDTHPQVVSAKQRVGTLQGQLKEAQDTYNQKIAAPKAKVDEEQTKYNNNLKPFKEKVGDAERNVGVAKQTIEDVKVDFGKLEHAVGFWKNLWWKIRYHKSAKDVWQEFGPKVAVAMAKTTGSSLA